MLGHSGVNGQCILSLWYPDFSFVLENNTITLSEGKFTARCMLDITQDLRLTKKTERIQTHVKPARKLKNVLRFNKTEFYFRDKIPP